ncbi:AT-hook motif nuclear-localized protein 1-like [Medicago truncatula]|uniref:AT-hook motif nuclear-localized protein 1-like n=1 Tax=Medicago truncatula TaxID=3880 RepID=UPI001966F2D3|nr:AT-hook motif nuclear-localized protein 1-like [Medicago truncatula]
MELDVGFDQLLASSVGAIINLDPDEDTIVLPKKLIHEDQTQHPQEVEHQVSNATAFTPHISIITVKAGENVTMKVMSSCRKEPEAICILSAIGVISSATISQPHSSEKLSTYEGKYCIVSLSGPFMPNESRGGGMSISLMGLDGHVVEGCVAGPLMAESPVKVSTWEGNNMFFTY